MGYIWEYLTGLILSNNGDTTNATAATAAPFIPYLFYTELIFIILLLALFLFFVIKFYRKRPMSFASTVFLISCCVGMYLLIPSRLYWVGIQQNANPEVLKLASKITFFKYERDKFYTLLSLIYGNSVPTNKYVNGNLAIDYKEKVLNGDYSKFSKNLGLIYLYLVKGDYNKVLEIEGLQNKIIYTPYAYMLMGEYENALITFSQKGISESAFPTNDELMICAINEELGYTGVVNEMKKGFSQKFVKVFGGVDMDAKKAKYYQNRTQYLSVDAYKKFIAEKRMELKF